jgi:hypothetical protein
VNRATSAAPRRHEVFEGTPSERTAEDRRPRHEARERFEAVVDLDKMRSRGSLEARVAILEFGDYRCGFCARFQEEVWPELEKQYVMTGRVLFGYRHLPLSGLEGPSAGAARVAECADARPAVYPHARFRLPRA